MLIPDAPAVQDMAEGMTVIPDATYNLKVHKAEYVPVPKGKDAKGPYIKTQLIVTGPGDAGGALGRIVFMNYSLSGDGSFRLRELLEVTNHPADFKLENTEQLLGLEFGAAVATEKGTGGYPDKNVVKKHVALV